MLRFFPAVCWYWNQPRLSLSLSFLVLILAYNLIIRQHKSAALQVTSLQLSPSNLLVGTSAGVVLAVPLPYIEPSLEPHPLSLPPTPTPLHQGHVDTVHFLSTVQRGDETLLVTGGNGCEDFHKAKSLPDIPETASCLLVWNVKQWLFHSRPIIAIFCAFLIIIYGYSLFGWHILFMRQCML